MNCALVREMLGAYVDGELDANAELQLRLHLSECESCTAAFHRLRIRKQMIQKSGLSYRAPAELEARIRKSLKPDRTQSNWRLWGAVAAAILVASTLSIRLTQHLGARDQLADQMISGHVRAMMTGHTTDVVSTDRHTVKPWFNGRIDFSPPVADLAAQGFPLTGGRVDYLDGRVAATLVYQRRKHVIDLFVWPARSDDASGSEASKGFNVVRWQNGGMSFAAVSDLNQAELEQFKNLLLSK